MTSRAANPAVRLGALALVLALGVGLRAGEVIPPRPDHYFNDYAGLVSPAVAGQLNQQLEQFERDTSNQIVVAIYPHLQSDSDIDDYKVRVAQAWGVGQKGRNNGAVLFVFVQDRKLAIATGYGLEGALPDGICQLILAREIQPRFKQGDYAGGLQAGIAAMIAATRGEYHGTGRTNADRLATGFSGLTAVVIFLFVVLISFVANRGRQRSAVYQRRGPGSWGGPPLWLGGGGLFGGGGGFSGGGGFGGGGGFSGGGGGFGGGGASGGW
ncbi:MAG TPA: TPM domain-containing protein [Opitutaceae bacterium]|nr:TPM domain-containing protein [Opitutaceae bacterium]